MNEDHEDKNLLVCEYCSEGFKTSHLIDNHIDLKHKKINFSCPNCDQVFHKKNALSIHITKIHKGGVYKCDSCPFEATQRRSFVDHERIHGDEYLECGICDYKCKTRNSLQMHKHNKHVRKTKTRSKKSCEFCFKEYTNFTQHMIEKHGWEKHKCKVCNFEAKQVNIIKSHMIAKHGWEKYKCKLCDYEANQKIMIKHHFIKDHGGEKFKCTQCVLKVQKSNLKRHAAKHKDDFIALHYKATTKGNLKRHRQSIHERIKHPCDQCDYKAKKKVILRNTKNQYMRE